MCVSDENDALIQRKVWKLALSLSVYSTSCPIMSLPTLFLNLISIHENL